MSAAAGRGTRYLTAVGTFDRSAIMRGAWAQAHALAKALREAPAPFRRETTARALFPDQLRQVWDSARAEAARRAALSDRDRRIENAERELIRAEHADKFTAANNAAVVAARAQIASLQAIA